MKKTLLKFFIADLIKSKERNLKSNIKVENYLQGSYMLLTSVYYCIFMFCFATLIGWTIHAFTNINPMKLMPIILLFSALIFIPFYIFYYRKMKKSGICESLYEEMISYSKEEINKCYIKGALLLLASIVIPIALFILSFVYTGSKL